MHTPHVYREGPDHNNWGKIMKGYLCTISLLLATVLTACGTTSDVRPTSKPDTAVATPAQKGKPSLDLSGYSKVVVLDFVDATDKSKIKPANLDAYTTSLASAVRTFPDLIAQELRDSGAFPEVVRGPSKGKALLVSGRITRLTEGNSTLRFLVGMGAGSSYFDATTELGDAETGQSLGEVATNKNSWALGGGLASGQTVESFMHGAAKKIAAEMSLAKKGTAAAKAH